MSTSPLMLNVIDHYDVQMLCVKLRDLYISKGFQVTMAPVGFNMFRLQLEKDCGGLNTLLGLGKGIAVTLSLQGNCLMVNYSDAEWTSKVVGLVVGWFLCLVPFITALVGCVGQSNLPGEINNDIMMLVNTVGPVPNTQM